VTGIYVPNPRKFESGSELVIAHMGEKNDLIINSGGASITLTNKKVNVKAVNGLFLNGEEVFTGKGGTGGGSGGGNLGSREDYAKNMINDMFNADFEKMYASYLKFPRIRAWGLANRQSFDELNSIIMGQ